MVRASDREINSDHVMRHGHSRVERRGTRMIAVARSHPRDTGGSGLLDGDLGRTAHDQVTHRVVAIEQRCGGLFTDDADVGPSADASALNALHVLGEAKDAVTFRAAGIGFSDEGSDAAGVRLREADGF